MTVWFLWRLFKCSVKGEIWRVCGGLSWGDLLERPEDLSDFEPDFRAQVRVVLGVIDVLVFPSSVVTEFCDGFSCYSDWEDLAPKEEVRYESSQVKAPPSSKGRMMPPTPLQNSNDTFEEDQGAFCGGRSDVECERKNDNRKNETVFRRKLQCESGS